MFQLECQHLNYALLLLLYILINYVVYLSRNNILFNLPLFPLNLVLLPYEYLPLHIFEPRYKKMVKNSLENDDAFGIILSQGESVFNKGVKVGISKVFKEYSNGEYDILVKGQDPFDVITTRIEDQTIIGQVEYVSIQTDSNNPQFQTILNSYIKILLKFGINKDLDLHMNKKISYEFLQGLQLPLSLKKELISINKETDRLIFINEIFYNLLKSDIKNSNFNMPQA